LLWVVLVASVWMSGMCCVRQGLLAGDQSLNVLIERYLPLEIRQLLIPVARAGNVVEIKPF